MCHVEIYPREGTETLAPAVRRARDQVEIYPREGTETITDDAYITRITNVEIYPREGTETKGGKAGYKMA